MESQYLPRQALLSLRQSNDPGKNKQFRTSLELAFRWNPDLAIHRGVWRTRFAFSSFPERDRWLWDSLASLRRPAERKRL